MFDPDVLRTFVTGVSLGNFAKAAEKLGRSTSAVSAQMRKLEIEAGTALLKKNGRGLGLTEDGKRFLKYANRIVDLHEEAALAMKDANMKGALRIGMPEDIAIQVMPSVLNCFKETNPNVYFDAAVSDSDDLLARLRDDRLDMIVAWDFNNSKLMSSDECIGTVPLRWLEGSEGPTENNTAGISGNSIDHQPVPLILMHEPCPLRNVAINTLERNGISYRQSFSCSGLSAVWAAVRAGVGVTLRPEAFLPEGIRAVKQNMLQLPNVNTVSLSLYCNQRTTNSAYSDFKRLLINAIKENLDAAAF